jgi:RNA polymerase sigma-70 factor (ECF subfamily)
MGEELSFHDLIERVRGGDQEAAAELIRRYEPTIRLVIRRRLRDPRLRQLLDTTDVCQSILGTFFVRVALGEFKLDTPDELVKLLTTMALNKLRNYQRHHHREKRDPGRVEPGGLDRGLADPGPGPSDVAANKELLQEVFNRLSEEERRLVELHGQRASWAEVAATLGGSPDARRVQYQRAILRVIRALGLSE